MNKQRGYYSLKIGGKNRTMHFSMNFWASLTEVLDVGLQDLEKVFSDKSQLSSIRAIIYCGLLAYDQEEGNDIDYNIYKVGSWLDDLNQEEFQNVMQAMTETKILGNEINAGIERTQKKNQQPTR
jgi:topoisomerase IA-like protein|tara:strand:- start:581 stop:955 length:375 start_codon:yes stop_codon:yes gene_type:complete